MSEFRVIFREPIPNRVFIADDEPVMRHFLEGLEIVHYKRSEKRLMKIPIMIITAEENLKLMNDSFSAGATAFLPKPFTSDQLESAISMLLHSQKMARGAG